MRKTSVTLSRTRRVGIGVGKSGLLSVATFLLLEVFVAACAVNPTPEPPYPTAGLNGYPGQNPSATRTYLASRSFVEDSVFDGRLECHSATDCGGADSVHLRIVPERSAHIVPVQAGLRGGPGHVVARIINLTAKPYGSFGLAANDTGYVWVGSMPSGPPRIAVFRISTASGAATGLVAAAQAGYCPLIVGGPGRTIPAVHMNAMPECQSNSLYDRAASKAVSSRRLASTSPVTLPSALGHLRGLWFSCNAGCCEATGFEPM